MAPALPADEALAECLGHAAAWGAAGNCDPRDEILTVEQAAVRCADRNEIGQFDDAGGFRRPGLNDQVERDLDREVATFGTAGALEILHGRAVSECAPSHRRRAAPDFPGR